MRAYTAYKGKAGAEQMTVRKAFPEMIFDADPYRDDVNKISFILENYTDYLDAKAKFKNFQVNTWGGVGETALFGDVARADIDKHVGVTHLLEKLGLSAADAFAFGDAKVDIPMMQACGTAIAMGNAGKETKAFADYITKTVEADGLYHAFRYYHLI